MLNFLLQKPNNNKLKIISLISGIFFFLITAFFLFEEIETKIISGYGLLDFELSFSKAKATSIFINWGYRYIPLEIMINQLDFIYMLVYATFFFTLALLLTRAFKENKYQQLGLYCSFFPIIVAISDVFETINLLIMLYSPFIFDANVPLVASIFATIKITFIVGTFSYLLFGYIFYSINKNK